MAKLFLHLIQILWTVRLLPQTGAQAVDPNLVDFTTVPGYDDLKRCVQLTLDYLPGDAGCSYNDDGYTNACLCRPSTLGSAVQIIQDNAMDRCDNMNDDDKNQAKTILLNYCASKGYTSVVTPGVSQTPTGGYTVTATVTQVVTSTITTTARSSSSSSASSTAARSLQSFASLCLAIFLHIMILSTSRL